MEFIPEVPPQPAHWRATNSGREDALNIASDQIESYGITAKIDGIQRLAVGASVDLSFATRQGNRYFGRSAHPTTLIGAVRKGAEGTTGDPTEYTEIIANHVIPVRLTYTDPRGIPFETRYEIRWNHITKKGRAHHVRSGPIIGTPWWRRQFRRLRDWMTRKKA